MRARLINQEQKDFLNQAYAKSGLGWDNLGKSCGVSGRTLRDWRVGKFTASYEVLLKLSDQFGLKIPSDLELLDNFWYTHKGGRKGGKRRYEIYGPLGNKRSRRKGGLVSQERRRRNPEFYRKIGCNVANQFKRPLLSPVLAEFIGIILGDGSIKNYQVTISLSRYDDRNYAFLVKKMILDLFGYKASMSDYNNKGVLVIRINGVNFVSLMESLGLKRGNKVKNGACSSMG